MTTQTFTATIHDPDRAVEWLDILGTTAVPVKSFYPHLAQVLGQPKAKPVYELDLDQLTPDQHQRLIRYLATKYQWSTRWVENLIIAHGVPILATNVTVTTTSPPLM